MSFLSDVEIKKAIESKDIQIESFEEKNLEPSSYDFKIGRALIAGRGIAEKKDFPLFLKPGDWMEIESLEVIRISQKIGVVMGMPSGMSRKGILAFSGMHIDPGYQGRIFITLFNPSSDTYKIEHGQKLSTALFFNFNELPSRCYEGQHQGRYHFPEKDVEWMIRLKAPTIADAIKSVEELEKMIIDVRSDLGGAKGEITEIRNDLKVFKNDMDWIKKLLMGILIALIVGIVGGVAVLFIAKII